MPQVVSVSVAPLPVWVDAARLLGVPGPLAYEPVGPAHVRVTLALEAQSAADVAARLRGLGLDGQPLEVRVEPPLARAHVRAARLRDARARRSVTPGFLRSGVRVSGEGRYSLTPEPLALAIGQLAGGASVVDACCGSGGNTIGFARAGARVIAIEQDGARLAEARHNAAVYGVAGQVGFVHGDALAEVPNRSADVLFIDPPWGEQYDKRHTSRASFPLLHALLEAPLGGYEEVWVKVPGSFAVASIPGAVPAAWFGTGPGDAHRIKFVLLRMSRRSLGS